MLRLYARITGCVSGVMDSYCNRIQFMHVSFNKLLFVVSSFFGVD